MTPIPEASGIPKYDAQGNALSEEEMKDAVTVENGVYTFQLKHLERIEVTIPYGVEYTVSEDAEDYDVQITGTPESVESGEDTYTAVIHENTDLTFTNTKDIPPATGIRRQAAPYLVMTGVQEECLHCLVCCMESGDGWI